MLNALAGMDIQKIFPFISVSFFFFSFCSFQYTGFASLLEFIPRYCIIFDAIVNGIVFLIFFLIV